MLTKEQEAHIVEAQQLLAVMVVPKD